MRERIVAASIRLPDGSFQTGTIHGDAWQTAVDQGRHPAEYYPDEDDHFFLTSFGRHVDRETAYEIADRARQLDRSQIEPDERRWRRLGAEHLKGK